MTDEPAAVRTDTRLVVSCVSCGATYAVDPERTSEAQRTMRTDGHGLGCREVPEKWVGPVGPIPRLRLPTRVPVAGTDDSVPVVLPNQVRVLDESGEPCGMATLHEVNGVEALYVCPVHIGGRFASGRWSFEDGRGRLIEVQLMNAPGFHVAEGS